MKDRAVNQYKKALAYKLMNCRAFILFLILVSVARWTTGELFLSGSNIISLLRQLPVSIIVAMGFTIVLGSGGFDMSIKSMVSMLTCLYVFISQYLPFGVAILITLIVSLFCGMFNGIITEWLNVTPFIVTFATGLLFSAAAKFITKGNSIGGLSSQARYLGTGSIFGIIPVSLIIVAVITSIIIFIMRMMMYGRRIVAIGENRKALELSGIRVKRLSISAYMVMGFCCAVGAILLAGRVNLAFGGVGGDILTKTIAAVLIGGTSIRGGKINMLGTIFGCLTIAVMDNMFGFLNIGEAWRTLSECLIIISVLFFESYMNSLLKTYDE